MFARIMLVLVSLVICLGSRESLQAQSFARAPDQLGPPVAIVGEPFGVFHAELPLPPNFPSTDPRILVEEAAGRVFYPVVAIKSIEVAEQLPPPAVGRPGGLIDRLRTAVRGEPSKREVPVAISVMGLFRGDAPLDIELVGDFRQALRIKPIGSPRDDFRPLLNAWWQEYTRSAADALQRDDFPTLVHKYLTSTLARRLDLPYVDIAPPRKEADKPQNAAARKRAQPLETLSLLAAIEPLREEILEDVLVHPSQGSVAEMPVPQDAEWEPRLLPPLEVEVSIEPIAQRVPPECYYLRFGSFANYIWFQDITARYGGDIAQSVLLRGFNYEASARAERMMATKMTTLAKMFGDRLIDDMAVIGSDLYMKEGASLGVLFKASNPALLRSSIDGDRRALVQSNPQARLSEQSIAGTTVSLLSTPDNHIRSFMVVDGNYLFVTTSQTLMRRFIEVGTGEPSLADSPEFRWSRTWMPEANDYSIFAYFSPQFFHRLVSPQYQIELRRRLEAIAHLEIAEVARQAGVAEGLDEPDIERLQTAGLLPPWFDERSDGAQTLRSDQQWIDSLRGARGSFLPIADVELLGVTTREASAYAELAEFYQRHWRHMDPMMIGLRRFQSDDSIRERVAVEAYVAPFEAQKYGWIANLLAGPTPVTMQLAEDDVISVSLHMSGRRGLGPPTEDYHLFAGVKDMMPPDEQDTQGLIRTLQALRSMPAYIGAWPKPGLIEQLPLGLGIARPDIYGFTRMLGGLYRWEGNQVSLISFNRSILENAIPQIRPITTSDMAQARAQVVDLTGTQLGTWINRKWYERGWRASHANAQLLDAVHQQLKVPSQDCFAATERLLDVRLQCPLGGEYQFQSASQEGHGGWWQSTAWADAAVDPRGRLVPPPTYSAPWVDWFRGGRAHLTQDASSLAAVATIDLELQPLSVDVEPSLQESLPSMNFDLFSLPKKLFGGAQEKEPQPLKRSF